MLKPTAYHQCLPGLLMDGKEKQEASSYPLPLSPRTVGLRPHHGKELPQGTDLHLCSGLCPAQRKPVPLSYLAGCSLRLPLQPLHPEALNAGLTAPPLESSLGGRHTGQIRFHSPPYPLPGTGCLAQSSGRCEQTNKYLAVNCQEV